MLASQIAARVADHESCAQEPIHLIGFIQSHGLLFALSEPDFTIRQVSANVEALLGRPVADIFGASFERVLGPRQFETFRTRLRADDLVPERSLRVSLGNDGLAMNCAAHRHDGMLIVELELVRGAHTLPPSELSANIQILLTRMERASDTLDYARVAADEMERLAGFDRVMIYRFDTEWNGEVIAESGKLAEPHAATQTSYLGMSFPASDIPIQARRLFLINPVRAIADVDSAPVPIVCDGGPAAQPPLDLTFAFLRSPSLVHVEYLQNIGVRSSLTVSIIVEERLWGMIACHHHAPRAIDCSTRAICEMIARNLALQVALRNATAARQARLFSTALLEDYGEAMEASGAPVDGESIRGARFLELLDADGLVWCLDGVVSSWGVSPPPESLLPVIGTLRALASRGIASTDRLGVLDQSAAPFSSEASGALFIELSKRTGDYLLFLRCELLSTVIWAGNPDKAVSVDLAGKLHPRRSFAAWQETVRGRARPWSEPNLESARSLRAQLLYLRNAEKLRELE